MSAFLSRIQQALILAVLVLAAGCATTATPEAAREARDRLLDQSGVTTGSTALGAVVTDRPYVDRTAVPYRTDGARNVSVAVTGAPLGGTIEQIAVPAGYTVAFASGASGASPSTRVSLTLREVSAFEAMRRVAFAAGYVAVIDRSARLVTVSARGTYVFRLPPALFDEAEAAYKVGTGASTTTQSSATSSDSSGSSGGGSGDSGTSFKVDGKRAGEDRARFEKNLQTLAEGGQVTLNWTAGSATVEGNARTLQRVRGFLAGFAGDALTQVEIETTLVRVDLSNRQQFGIDWSRVLEGSARTVQIGISGAAAVTAPALTAQITGASVTSVINALEQQGSVRYVAQPRLLAQNRQPATLTNATQVPYLGSVGSTSTGVAGTTTSSAAVSYAMDGVSLSFIPSVLDESNIALKIIPILSSVGEFSTFETPAGVLQAPRLIEQKLYIDTLTRSGATLILAGSRSTSAASNDANVPLLSRIPVFGRLFGSLSDANTAGELLMLVTARLVPAPQHDPLIGEAL